MFLFDLTQLSQREQPFPWGRLSKTISSNSLTQKLPEAEITDGTKMKLTTNLKIKLENEMSTEGFEKLLHILGDLEGNVHGQAVEMPEKVLISHLWLTLRLCLSRKWKLR